MNPLLAPAVAMLAYPGLLAAFLSGLLAESVIARVASQRGRPGASALGQGLAGLPPAAWLGAMLAALAAAQLAAPFNPVPPAQRNVLVAAIALSAGFWLAAAAAGPGPWSREGGWSLAVQGGWLLAVLGPAVVPENLRPQVLGAVALPALLPLRIICATLYLLCLPALLRLQPGRRPAVDETARTGAPRLFLWLPSCGLFTSVFVSPPTDDVPGLLRFFAVSVAAGATVLGLAALSRSGGPAWAALFSRAVLAAGVAAAILLLTAVLTR